MKKLLLILAIIFAYSFSSQPVFAEEVAAGNSAVLKNEVVGIKPVDPRVEKLTNFLAGYNSPLVPFAKNFIEAADRYSIDWKLVPAITGVESTFGKNIPFNSFNAYGWNNGVYRFESWEQSINHVSQVLKEKYFDRGLDTPWKIGPVYAPPSSTWAGKVDFFMKKIDCVNQNDCLKDFDLTI